MHTRTPVLLCFLLASFARHTRGVLNNVTIDDQNGDPTTGQYIQYSPSEAWRRGQDCNNCTARPNAARTFDGTWMDATYFPDGIGEPTGGQILYANVSFTGIAVYVQVILTGTIPNILVADSDFTFFIDDTLVGTFQNSTSDLFYVYNQTIFSITGLSNSLHNFTIEVGRTGMASLVLLDSIIYTQNISSTSDNIPASNGALDPGKSKKLNIGLIIGAIFGAVGVLAAILGIFCLHHRLKSKHVHFAPDTTPRPIHHFRPGPRALPAGQRRGPNRARIPHTVMNELTRSDSTGIVHLRAVPISGTPRAGRPAGQVALVAPLERCSSTRASVGSGGSDSPIHQPSSQSQPPSSANMNPPPDSANSFELSVAAPPPYSRIGSRPPSVISEY
ncbi:uncharacterized protein FOMMEDRAFT_145466 [Fomitiporia mediterranea MF3/22]|uniref:uncharacterized protein n=1 Tax=Fomitiporia mediterranea (strain MF3/22) TaxID=694068 RepID=UPI00044089B4|nr:uncharacterized protein FOMMEDRAFT_145466 [Fomitiporia mediterranea MF3/22]EJD06217.1 hypothetical protein FOMMEDRAFT_145466 [Fomitiporia mediterranea MF3/22]